jgi:hypothetical protein
MKCIFLIVFLVSLKVPAQQIQLLTSGTKTSIRGLSVVNDQVIWASGSNGNIARSTDGGATFDWQRVKGYDQRDFRDIEAFDSNTAIIMAVAEPAVLLKTSDGGRTWREVFRDTTKGMFLDAMDFADNQGVMVGDPVNDKIFMAYSNDYGDTWKVSPIPNEIKIVTGEAFFASSGTNIKLQTKKFPVFVSGGKRSSIYISSTAQHVLPLMQGEESTGANSIAIAPGKPLTAVVVGGDFSRDTVSAGIAPY